MASAANTLRKQVTPQQMQAMNNVLNTAAGLPNPLMPQWVFHFYLKLFTFKPENKAA